MSEEALDDLEPIDDLLVEDDVTVDSEVGLLDNPLTAAPADDPDKIPWKLVIPLGLLQIVEAFNANALFSYLPYMIVWFGMVDSVDEAGFYGGPLAAVFYLGQFCSSFFWGLASDRFGKRPILLFGSFGTLVTVMGFGFSPNYYVALVARFLGGLLNGNIGVAKALLGQIATKNTQTILFGLFGICWGAGAVVASFYGGFTVQLAEKYPSVFAHTLFDTFPFLMPNIITSAVAVGALVSGYFFIHDPPGGKKGSVGRAKLKILFRSKQSMLTCFSYGMLGGVTTMMQELLPLWLASSPDRGGFEFESNQVGYANMAVGVWNIVILLTIYTPFARRVGLRNTYRIGYAIIIPTFGILLPLCSYFPATSPWLWVSIVILSGMRSLYGQFTFSTVFSLISNSVDDVHLLGSINGFGQSLVSLSRCVAPLVIAPLFAWSIKEQRHWPVNYWFSFGIIMLGHFGLLLLSFSFEEKLEMPLKDRATEEVELAEPESP